MFRLAALLLFVALALASAFPADQDESEVRDKRLSRQALIRLMMRGDRPVLRDDVRMGKRSFSPQEMTRHTREEPFNSRMCYLSPIQCKKRK